MTEENTQDTTQEEPTPEPTPAPEEDPSVLGKMTAEEVAQIDTWKGRANQLNHEVGRQGRRLWKMKAEADTVEKNLDSMCSEIENIEVQAQEYLNKVGERFGVKPGEPWQMTPNGTAKRVDPVLLQKAQAALNNAAAAAQAPEETPTPPE